MRASRSSAHGGCQVRGARITTGERTLQMRKFLVSTATAAVAAAVGLGVVAPTGALAFNPQPDPPKVALRAAPAQRPACSIIVALPVLIATVSLPRPAAGILPSDV